MGLFRRIYFQPGTIGWEVPSLNRGGYDVKTLVWLKRFRVGISLYKHFVIGYRGSAIDLGYISIFRSKFWEEDVWVDEKQ